MRDKSYTEPLWISMLLVFLFFKKVTCYIISQYNCTKYELYAYAYLITMHFALISRKNILFQVTQNKQNDSYLYDQSSEGKLNITM